MFLISPPVIEGPRLRGAQRAGGFSLVEILIVVVILGVLAAMVVPQFSSAASASRENSAKMDLFRVREQLEIYKQQHNGEYPPLATFAECLTQASRVDHTTAAPGTAGFHLGPYLRDIPSNPFTSNNTVDAEEIADGNGWYYNEATGEFRANDSEAHAAY